MQIDNIFRAVHKNLMHYRVGEGTLHIKAQKHRMRAALIGDTKARVNQKLDFLALHEK